MLLMLDRIFLFSIAIILVPVAMSYGINPTDNLLEKADLVITSTNQVHIFRAYMGLYLGHALFWIMGASISKLRTPALYSVILFMFSLAAGRLFSIVIDGIPNQQLLSYLLAELVIGTIAVVLCFLRPKGVKG